MNIQWPLNSRPKGSNSPPKNLNFTSLKKLKTAQYLLSQPEYPQAYFLTKCQIITYLHRVLSGNEAGCLQNRYLDTQILRTDLPDNMGSKLKNKHNV
jgi:hypothetical protein